VAAFLLAHVSFSAVRAVLVPVVFVTCPSPQYSKLFSIRQEGIIMPLLSVPDLHAPLGTWAQWYGSNNWPVVPCRGKSPHLAQHGVKDATCDPFQIATWWRQWPDANIGTPMGHGRFALDVDPRHGGDDTLFALERTHGPLPHTLMSHTGGGGNHYIFLEPPGGIRNKVYLGQGIDVPSTGSLIIVPPSIHPDTGKPYLWDVVDGPDDIDPQPAPDWLLALLTAPATRQTPATTQTPATIPLGTRDNTLTQYAGSLRRAGASAEEIRAALDIRNQCCEVPLPGADLDRIARSIARYDPPPQMLIGSTPPGTGNGTPVQGTTDPQSWGSQLFTFDFSAGVSARDLVRQMMVPPRFLVDKLIPDGLTILAAPAKSYKSYFSLSLALATIGQGAWLDTFPVNETGNVVFFGLESPPMQLRNRLHQLAPGFTHDSSEHELIFFSGMRALPSFKNGLQQALEQVIERYTPRLIVIDPLSYLYRLGRQDDLASATLDLLWPLAEMAAAAQVALLAPEHMRKRSKEDVSVIDQLAGSHIKAAVVHGLLMMHREGEDIVIDTTMRDAPSQEFAVTLTFDETQHTVSWHYKGTMATLGQSRLTSMKSTVLDELKARRYPMKVADIILHCGLVNTDKTRDNVRQILHLAEKDGLLASSKKGEYYWIGQ
jgi:hypothetical protein